MGTPFHSHVSVPPGPVPTKLTGMSSPTQTSAGTKKAASGPSATSSVPVVLLALHPPGPVASRSIVKLPTSGTARSKSASEAVTVPLGPTTVQV